jgi:hypothetical protein
LVSIPLVDPLDSTSVSSNPESSAKTTIVQLDVLKKLCRLIKTFRTSSTFLEWMNSLTKIKPLSVVLVESSVS